jgi:hypothetical protein
MQSRFISVYIILLPIQEGAECAELGNEAWMLLIGARYVRHAQHYRTSLRPQCHKNKSLKKFLNSKQMEKKKKNKSQDHSAAQF